MTTYLLYAAIIILICVLLNKLTARIGVPMLLAFILLGMMFGSDGLIKIPFANFELAEKICSVALIFIMFYGGFDTNWNEAKNVAVESILLASVGVVLTALFTGLFCHFVLEIGLLESMLIGSIISSTDAASVFSILRAHKLGLKNNTSSLLELESGSNDPSSYMLTMIMILWMGAQGSSGSILYMLFAQIVFGLLFGALFSLVSLFVLKRFKFATAGFEMVFTIGIAIMAYALPSLVGGNGYLSVYIVGIVLGNSNIKNKRSLIHFFNGITGLMQILIFFLLGLLSFASKLPSVFVIALPIALFLTFVARPLAVFLLMTPLKSPWGQQLVVAFAGLRGAASIVFAIMATVSGVSTENDIFHIVFCIVLLSICFQGSLIPWVSRKLNMIDADLDVLKTFNDYVEETDVQFIRLNITESHLWSNRRIRDIAVPPETLVVMIMRDNQPIIPNGDTLILANDVVILSALAYQEENAIKLREQKVGSSANWKDRKVSEFSTHGDELVILIKRDGKSVIPRGDTIIQKDDILVLYAKNEYSA